MKLDEISDSRKLAPKGSKYFNVAVGDTELANAAAYVYTAPSEGDPNHNVRTKLVAPSGQWQIDERCLWDDDAKEWDYCT